MPKLTLRSTATGRHLPLASCVHCYAVPPLPCRPLVHCAVNATCIALLGCRRATGLAALEVAAAWQAQLQLLRQESADEASREQVVGILFSQLRPLHHLALDSQQPAAADAVAQLAAESLCLAAVSA